MHAKNPCAGKGNGYTYGMHERKVVVEMGGVEPPSKMINRLVLQA